MIVCQSAEFYREHRGTDLFLFLLGNESVYLTFSTLHFRFSFFCHLLTSFFIIFFYTMEEQGESNRMTLGYHLFLHGHKD